MGDPRKPRKKYETPTHPWQGDRIKAEKVLMREYGLKNKKELWKMSTLLKGIKTQVKFLISREQDEESQKEKEQLLNRLSKLGIITTADAKLEDILGLDVKSILERRLQTVFYRKGLSKSVKQARQFIVHGHATVGDKKIDVPSYLVPVEEESTIAFNPVSPLEKADHPERETKKSEKPKIEKPKEDEEAKEAEKVEEKLEEVKAAVEDEEKIAEVEKEVESKENKEEAKEE